MGVSFDIAQLPWQTWSPTFDASASMTWSGSPTTVIARYAQLGKTVFFEVNRYATTGGTPSPICRFTLPIVAAFADANSTLGGGCAVAVSGSWLGGFYYLSSNGSTVNVLVFDQRNYDGAATAQINVSGCYEVA